MKLPISLILAGASVLPSVLSWGAAGHEMVATIAQIHLHPSTKQKLCNILPAEANCHLAPVAAWADQVRNRYRGTAPMHYVNGEYISPSSTCLLKAAAGWVNEDVNVITAIQNFTRAIIDGKGGKESDVPLRFLVHFLGDIHQPMHLSGRDKGGNGGESSALLGQTPLHSVWDSGIITKNIRELGNYTSPVPSKQIEDALLGTIFDPYVRFIVWEGIRLWWQSDLEEWLECPASGDPFPHSSHTNIPASTSAVWKDYFRTASSLALSLLPGSLGAAAEIKYAIPTKETEGLEDQALALHPTALTAKGVNMTFPACPYTWAKPIHGIACDVAWPEEYTGRPGEPLIELDTDKYLGRIGREKVIEKLLAMGGLRLAKVLNEALANEEELLDPSSGSETNPRYQSPTIHSQPRLPPSPPLFLSATPWRRESFGVNPTDLTSNPSTADSISGTGTGSALGAGSGGGGDPGPSTRANALLSGGNYNPGSSSAMSFATDTLSQAPAFASATATTTATGSNHGTTGGGHGRLGYVPDLTVPNGSMIGGNWASGTLGETEHLVPRSHGYFPPQSQTYSQPQAQAQCQGQTFPMATYTAAGASCMNMDRNENGSTISRGGSGQGSRRSVSRTNSGSESISGRGGGGGGTAEWKYEMRREAQEILPGLYLGPFQSSTNLDKMRMMGITHILCVRDQKEARLIYPRFPTEFKYMTLDISDNTDQNLITIFPKCRDFIEEAMSMGGTVLAHCNGGIALSPAIVIGYLMWKFSWSGEKATAFVQNKRYCVSTMSFSNQFKEYEPIQLAQKMVQAAGGVSGASGHKRQATDDDDEPLAESESIDTKFYYLVVIARKTNMIVAGNSLYELSLKLWTYRWNDRRRSTATNLGMISGVPPGG
ncbi:nuclease I [Kwoniella heveanensis CBS 569]|nr:nuclease I [Kwoniella heveanensis CBS 569]